MIVSIPADFDLDLIVHSGQCFRPGQMADGRYRFIHRDNLLYIAQSGDGKYEISCTREEWSAVWSEYFDLTRDYGQVRNQIPRFDGFLSVAAARCTGLRILRQDPWETLISFIISQRKTIPAIRTSIERLCRRFGRPIPDGDPDCYGFPAPEALSRATPEELADCGLGYRAQYIHEAAAAAASGAVDLSSLASLSDADLLQELMKIRGVGTKIANCVCLFSYARVNCAPVDVWISRVLDLYYAGKSPFETYASDAGIFQQYMFVYCQSQKASIRATAKA